jgi:hypothetical protein
LEAITGDKVHISVHIEGTTNASFLAELGGIYGTEQVLVYQLSRKRFVRLSELPNNPAANLLRLGKDLLESTPLLNQIIPDGDYNRSDSGSGFTLEDLPPNTAVVHGHFKPDLFQDIYDNPFVSVVLKDPLERMITLYKDWKRKKSEVDWRVNLPFDPKLPFTEFALQEDFINYQSQSLGDRRLGDYDLVGVAECQAGFIAQLKNQDWTDYMIMESPGYQLKKPPYKNLGISSEFVDEFQEVNQMDYSIYQQAKEFMGFC